MMTDLLQSPDANPSVVDLLLEFPWAIAAPRKDVFEYLADYIVRQIMAGNFPPSAPTSLVAGIGTLTVAEDLTHHFVPARSREVTAHVERNKVAPGDMLSPMRDDIKKLMEDELANLVLGCAGCARASIIRKYATLQRRVDEAQAASTM